LGKNEFLQLLAVQMSNQDPLEPTSDTEFIAQLATFSSLEQMQEMNQSITSARAYSMIGKDVFAEVTDAYGNKQAIFGRVSGVTSSGGTDYLLIGSYKAPLGAVTYVYDSGTGHQELVSQASNLIGKNIVAEVATEKTGEDGKLVTETVSGEVEYIVVENGILFAKLRDTDTMKDKKVMIADITKIEEKKAAES
jgi:flagellar basal-body rod modification protein FlgD